jgi:2-methylcitrate dehydratase
VVTSDGNKFIEKVVYHRGHFRDPMSDKEIEQKFDSLAQGLLTTNQIKTIQDMVWNLDQVNDISSFMDLLRIC